MYKLEFTLKQHTPLIHFQHDQSGATLRATEVKPKLDQFVIEKLLRDQNVDFDIYEEQEDGSQKFITAREAFKRKAKEPENEVQKKWVSWIVGQGKNEHVALDYKLHLLSKDKEPVEIKDVKLITEADKTATTSNDLWFSLRSLQEKLVEFIKGITDDFFVLTSFGNRQNKGWGNFLPEELESSEEIEEILISSGKAIFKCSRIYTSFNQDTYDQLMRSWRILKSGNNTPYKKSLLFQYMCFDKKVRWEKRAIKKAINSDIVNFPEGLLNTNGFYPIDCKEDKNAPDYFDWEDNPDVNYPYRFIRILLGLPEHFEFRTNDNNIVYQVIMESNDGIERFKAPVTFKWFNKYVYAIVEEIPDYLYSKNFAFKVQKKERRGNKWIPLNSPIPIIPRGLKTTNSFKLTKFLNEYLPQVGFTRLIHIES
jgi:hypothetical protein